MSDDPKKKGTPEAPKEPAAPNEDSVLSDDDLDGISGGTAQPVSPALREALKKAGRSPMT